jgi:putative ABC transport system permease protein
MGPTPLISNNTKTQFEDTGGREEREIINQLYPPEAVASKIQISLSETSLSFTATSNAEVKYEATNRPRNHCTGVDEYEQFWFRNQYRRNFTGLI